MLPTLLSPLVAGSATPLVPFCSTFAKVKERQRRGIGDVKEVEGVKGEG
jgi:hypothetical protein